MTQKTVLASSGYTKLMQNFAKENFNLKWLMLSCLCLMSLSLITTAYLLKQGPVVIALGGNGEVTTVETKMTDVQIEAAIKEYLEKRYVWDFLSVGAQLRAAEFFVDLALVPSFRKSMVETTKYVQEKKITQRLYPRKRGFKVDLKERVVSVIADRFTEFDGLKAASEANFKFWFSIGSRTPLNPWGVYVTKELEIGSNP